MKRWMLIGLPAASIFAMLLFLLYRGSEGTGRRSNRKRTTQTPTQTPIAVAPGTTVDGAPDSTSPPSFPPPTDAVGPITSVPSAADSSNEISASAFLLMSRDELLRRIPGITNPRELHGAVYALARYMDPTDAEIDAFVNLLQRTDDEKVLCTLLWGIGMREDRLPVATMAHFLANDSRADVRRAALRAMGTGRDERIAPLLRNSAEADRDPAVRGEAVFYLALQPRTEDAERGSVQALSRESDPEVRGRWVNLLGTMKTPTARETIFQVLYSSAESDAVRREAVESLGLSGDASLLTRVSQDARVPAELRTRAAELAAMLANVGTNP